MEESNIFSTPFQGVELDKFERVQKREELQQSSSVFCALVAFTMFFGLGCIFNNSIDIDAQQSPHAMPTSTVGSAQPSPMLTAENYVA